MMMRTLTAALLLCAATHVECGDRVAALAGPLEPHQRTSQSGGSATALQTFTRGAPSTTNNDDSCDIALLPAATLLLPYFEVDLSSRQSETTLFTITNVGAEERVAYVTLWTDYSYPVISFNVYLTGYDVQSIDLYDVLTSGRIAPPDGTGRTVSPAGALSRENPQLDASHCGELPAQLPQVYVDRLRTAFTSGTVAKLGDLPACTNLSARHPGNHAVGFATLDVIGSCAGILPEDPEYFTTVIRHDNVLVGDYQQVNRGMNLAQGGPLVHIRAVPEDRGPVNLPRTFYSRLQPGSEEARDRRQPLPSVFAARWIAGGTGSLQTDLKIWREAVTGPGAACSSYGRQNIREVTEAVLFDEEENAFGAVPDACPFECLDLPLVLQSTGRYHVGYRCCSRDQVFPEPDNGAIAGWIYLNLDDPTSNGAAQAWVISSMQALGLHSIDSDALALGNGCTPPVGLSEVDYHNGPAVIGPAPNGNP